MKIWGYMLVFLLGFFSCAFLFSLSYSGTVEFPMGINLNSGQAAPSDYFSEDDIVVMPNMIMISVSDASISRYAASGSMKPVLDSQANGIRIKPQSSDEIHVGDIITYEFNGRLVVHRVVKIETDFDGVYFVTAGDNNKYLDSKIRFEDVRYKTVGILY